MSNHSQAEHPSQPDDMPSVTRVFKPGDHAGWIYQNEEQYRRVMVSFVREGLEQNQRVLCLVDEHSREAVLDMFRQDALFCRQINLEECLKSEQLTVKPAKEVYLSDGAFDPDRMIALLKAKTQEALARGYSALRVTGEMTWALGVDAGIARLMEYENKLNDFFPGSRCLAICQYPERRFSPAILLDVLQIHPHVIVGEVHHENQGYLSPADFGRLTREGMALRAWKDRFAEQKRVEKALRESNLKFQALFDNSFQFIGLLTPDGTLIEVNRTALEFFGRKKADVLNQPFWETPWWTHSAKQQEMLRQAVKKAALGEIVRFEKTNIDKNGKIDNFDFSLKPARDNAGNVVYLVAEGRDITERKHEEEGWRKTTAYLDSLFNYANAPIIVWDPQFRITRFNHAFEFLTGWTADEVMGKKVDMLFPPAHLSHAMELIGKTLKGERWQSVEIEIQHRDGMARTVLWNSATLFETDGKTPIATIAQGQDITERKKAVEALRKTNAYLDNLFNYANAPIIVWDPQFRITRFNHAFEFLTGWTSREVLGKKVDLLFPPGRAEQSLELIGKTLKGERLQTVEIEIRHRDGSVRTVLWNSATLFDADGKTPVATIAQGQDITERKRAEEEWIKANRQLKEATLHANELAKQAGKANVAKSEFLANMSHEIRTPMNGIIGMNGLLLLTELDDDQRRYAEVVRNCGESLLALINDILDLSKIEAGKLELETLDFDLRVLFDDFAEMMAVSAHDKKLEFGCVVDPDVPLRLRGDAGRLRQVLINLTGNAIKFTREGGVSVRASLVSETEDHAMVRFLVKDSGIGIPEEKQTILFQKFTQVDASITRQYGGTGLGLAISKQLVALMGGEIGVNSQEGKGAEFWFTARLGKQVRMGAAP
ncbi:MAG: PAS domain S-box protein [Verrucomicrobiae bacterium]|nr:PAS domain S-box protein [Verrucomicrobiae bacterium]